jgi:hypothetical protein
MAHAVATLTIQLFRDEELLVARSPDPNGNRRMECRNPDKAITFIDASGKLF